ncbi:MarR family winged helix-turn-helix transcriptional regulator [Paenibacillus pasadenensis]|uniref:MarR family winged helix-turn-helix transcriptional regulator n=1 Tax=Paenibacillus TaxID=44249 RepID=UPI0004901FDF|nr:MULTISPECIES: MarR family transcriptional regulator [Paenibacillus]QGG57738.1 MarR family transcriptional regulator [Paenibacillus sp. B01]
MQETKLKEIIERYERASSQVNRRFGALIQNKLPEGITQEQFGIIRYLSAHPDSTSTELADTFCVGKSSITSITTKLVDKKLVRRRPDDRDRRVTYLSLTEEGRLVAEQAGKVIGETLGAYISRFTEEEAMQFIEMFEDLAARLKD